MAWRRVRFKDAVVLARCDEQGRLLAQGGRVEIRYRPGAGKAYRAAERNLAPIEGEGLLPDDACGDAELAESKASKGSGAAGRRRRENHANAGRAGGRAGDPPEGALVVYTDGACSGNPGPAGVGVVVVDGEQQRELSAYLGRATNNIAELTAIALALEALPAAQVGERPLRIYTDSQYSIGVLQKGWKAKANQALIHKIKSALGDYQDVELIYVRGHVGVSLNERADALAVDAVRSRESRGWLDG